MMNLAELKEAECLRQKNEAARPERESMPKLVCVQCHCELRPETSGITVIEMASFGPYKVWDADTWKCPGCGFEIVAGFGDRPLRQDHYADDFPAWLDNLVIHARRVEYDHERPAQ